MKIVIISQPRTGTSMLVNTLNSIDGVNMYGELFVRTENMGFVYTDPHPQEVLQKQLERFMRNSFDYSHKSVKNFLDELYSKEDKIVGFKLLYYHLMRKEGKEITNYIQSNDILKIIMFRENKMNQYISGISNRKDEVKIDHEHLKMKLSKLISQDKFLFDTFCNGNFIKISYEELTNNKDVKKLDLSWISEELGIVDVPLRKYKKSKILKK